MEDVNEQHIELLRGIIHSAYLNNRTAKGLIDGYYKAFDKINLGTLKIIYSDVFINFAKITIDKLGREVLEKKENELKELLKNTSPTNPQYKNIQTELNDLTIEKMMLDDLILKEIKKGDILALTKRYKAARNKKRRITIFSYTLIFIIAFTFAYLSDLFVNWSEPAYKFISAFLNFSFITPEFLKTFVSFLVGAIVVDPAKEVLGVFMEKKNILKRLDDLKNEIDVYNNEVENFYKQFNIDREYLFLILKLFNKQ